MYTHYLLFVFVIFYSYPLLQDQKQTSKRHRLNYKELLFDIIDLEWYCVIVSNSGTLFQKVSDICYKYYHYGFICLTVFILITYYWFSMLESISITINKKQHSRGTIWNTGYEN